MSIRAHSALVTDGGKVQFRLQGRFFEVAQQELRTLLELPPGPTGLGITIDGDNFQFEFPLDQRCKKVSARRLLRLLSRKTALRK